MKLCALVSFALGLLSLGLIAASMQQNDSYWETIKAHMEKCDRAASRGRITTEGEAFEAYLDSLGSKELIIAGRQASREMMQRYRRDEWPRLGISLAWFYQEYPKKTGDLAHIEPLLDEIDNAQRPTYWRWFLEDLLTDIWEREGRLSNEQQREISDTLLSVLEREDEHPAVVAGAAQGLPQTLAALKEDLPPAEEAKERREALRALTGFSERYLKTGAGLVSDLEADPAVLRAALGGLVRVAELGVAETGAARAALREAARNFASYPEELWPRLMLTAVKLGAEADFEKLLTEASDAAEQEQVAERLGAVRSLLDNTQVAAARKDDKESDRKASPVRRLGDCSPDELLVMARHRADLLAQGKIGEGAWSELSAILREYESRPEPR